MRILLTSLAASLLFAAPAGARTFSVYPSPHAHFAAPGTQIAFRGGADLGTLTVTGSRSGAHAGDVRAHSDGVGASWIPQEPFTPGERVTVRTHLHIAGARQGDYGFTVGEPVAPTPGVPMPVLPGRTQELASRPDLTPPAVTVSTLKPGAASGDIFLAPKAGSAQDGPMILDERGRLVWFHPISGSDLATDFKEQTYDGKPVLTWWQGHQFTGDGAGVGEIYDSSYREVARVHAADGLNFDLHEFTLTPRGTALITVYQRDKVGDQVLVDGIVQEIDVKTGLLEFEWHSLDHVAPSESYVAPQQGAQYDYFHINSIDEEPDGNLLISGRNTWTLYELDRATGNVLWRLGGKRSTFKLGPGAKTSWQHNARRQADGTITVYDNGAAAPGQAFRKHTRAITLRLDETAHTATLVSAFVHPRGLLTPSQGDVQRLPNGDDFVGYGSERWFSEYSPTGELVFDAHLATGNTSYRAYRFPWSGTPAEPPHVVATAKNGSVTATASWNGATGVAKWVLLAGPGATGMTPVGEAPANGFETTVTAATTQPMVAMQAYDAAGNRLTSSAAIKP